MYYPFLDLCGSEARKAEWLASRMLLRELTGKELDVAYHPNGYPYIADSEYNISISHTRGYAAAIVDHAHLVGIDIEYRSERVQRIKTRFLSETECDWLGGATTEMLLICWSAKEAVFKMTRKQTADFRKDITIQPFILSEKKGYVTVKEYLTEKSNVCRINYSITPEYVVAHGIL